MSDKIDIKDFSTISQLNPQDRLLVSQAGNGAHGKITVQLVIDAIKRLVSDGVDGKTVSLRKSGGWLEWQHEGDNSWQRLVSLDEIKGGKGDKGEDGKTPKLVSVNATAGESASGSITKSGDDSQGNPEYRIDLTLPRGQRGDDGSDGKTPRFEVGTISTLDPSQSATATVRYIGVHMDGSPKYAIDMAIPRGVAGTLGQGDAKDLSVTFSQAGSRSPLSSGSKLSVLFGLVKRWLTDLKEVALSGRFDDLIDKPTTLQGYGITDGAKSTHNHDGAYASKEHSHTGYATTDHDHDGAYAKKIHTHDTYAPRTHTHSEYAATEHNHDSAYSKLNHTHSEYAQATHNHPELERLSGANKVTTLTALPTSKRLVIANLSTATNITLSSPLSTGQEMIISINSTDNIKQPIPTAGGWISLDGAELDIKSGKVAEISILCVGTGNYVVSSKAGK